MKLLVYPFSFEQLPIIKRLKQNWDIDTLELILPFKSENTIIKDLNATVSSDYQEAFKNADSVLFLQCSSVLLHNDVVKKILFILDNTDKKISSIEEVSIEELGTIEQDKYGRISFYNAKTPQIDIERIRLNSQESIIIGVGNFTEDLDKTAVICGLYDEFNLAGYSVTAISTNPNTRLLGFEVFPYEILQDTGYDKDKVYKLNRYITKVEDEQCPEIILIQFPDGLMKYSNECCGNFGIYSYILSQAISFDYFILTVPYSQAFCLDTEYKDEIESVLLYRFGLNLDASIVANKAIDDQTTNENGVVQYFKTSRKETDDLVAILNESNSNIYSIEDEMAYHTIVGKCVDLLSAGNNGF
jgi:peptide maturation system protein (TIGR04066 family)